MIFNAIATPKILPSPNSVIRCDLLLPVKPFHSITVHSRQSISSETGADRFVHFLHGAASAIAKSPFIEHLPDSHSMPDSSDTRRRRQAPEICRSVVAQQAAKCWRFSALDRAGRRNRATDAQPCQRSTNLVRHQRPCAVHPMNVIPRRQQANSGKGYREPPSGQNRTR